MNAFSLLRLLACAAAVSLASCAPSPAPAADYWHDLQKSAVENGKSDFGHWGWEKDNYVLWGTHSNRLIPVYTFGTLNTGEGVDLTSYTGKNSAYRSEKALKRLYGYLPPRTLNKHADYLDQTNIYDIQKAALDAGRKYVFLVIFDGTDWQTTRAAAIAKSGKVAFDSGRGTGLHMMDYTAGGTTQFGLMVTSPHNDGTKIDVNKQLVLNPGGTLRGGYDVLRGGETPWEPTEDLQYLVSAPKEAEDRHAYTDSSCSASSMTTGIKSYNNAVNVSATGEPVKTIAMIAQDRGYKAGVVTSVPISHATPAAAMAHNVDRDDYQDITRDLIGRPSIMHPKTPLNGMDVVIGTGWGVSRDKDETGGENFVPGNPYLTVSDREAVDVKNGGKYVVAERTAGVGGAEGLLKAAKEARDGDHRLLGFYGVASTGHLPFQTADGDFNPTIGRKKTLEQYKPEDITENPTLPDMTTAAIEALSNNPKGFWLMIEAGDVDWANHDNNIDNSIGAVLSGDAAIKTVTDWVEKNSNWNESLMIVTADHGHYLVLEKPELLIKP
jgi:alkaline phosphatase